MGYPPHAKQRVSHIGGTRPGVGWVQDCIFGGQRGGFRPLLGGCLRALSRGGHIRHRVITSGFATRLSPWWSCLTVHPPARVIPCQGHSITRASRTPQTGAEYSRTPVAEIRLESADPVYELSARAILTVGVPAQQSTVFCRPERMRFRAVRRTRSVLMCERDALRLVNADNNRSRLLNQGSRQDRRRITSHTHTGHPTVKE